MNTKYLETLEAILEEGSFQKAALRLNYTQSTITFHIQQLEQELSCKLFDKVGRRMELSAAGKELLPYMEQMLRMEREMKNQGKGLEQMTGSLRVAVPDELLCHGMQPILQEFIRRAPKISLIVKALDCYAIREEIISGGADVGIHCEIGGYPETIDTELLTSYDGCLVASAAWKEAELDFITPHQRKELYLIVSDPHSVHQKRLERYLEQKDIVLGGTMELRSVGAAKTGVRSGLGLAYLPRFTVEQELQVGELVAVKTELDETHVPVVFAHHRNKWMSPPMQLFLDLARAYLPAVSAE